MQLKLTIKNNRVLSFPPYYNHQVQSAVYRALGQDGDFSSFIHNEGFAEGTNRFKLFTFGPLLGHYTIDGGKIRFDGNLSLEIRSPHELFIETLKASFLKSGQIKLFDETPEIRMIEITDKHIACPSINLITVSPIAARLHPFGGKPVYCAPDSLDFARVVAANAMSKFKSFYGEYPASKIEIVPNGGIKKVVTRYKDSWITAYSGRFLLSGSEKSLEFLYNAGLGCKNSQGFGMFDVLPEAVL